MIHVVGIGAGGHAKVVEDIVRLMKHAILLACSTQVASRALLFAWVTIPWLDAGAVVKDVPTRLVKEVKE